MPVYTAPFTLVQTIVLNLTAAEANGNLGTLAAGPLTPGATSLGQLTDVKAYNATDSIGLWTNSLESLTTGSNCTALGFRSLQNETIGMFNTALGDLTLTSAVDVQHNVAVGSSALYACVHGANYNTALGSFSMSAVTTGAYNTAVGQGSGHLITTGTNNVSIGYNTSCIAAATNAIAIGNGVNSAASNTAHIGNGAVTDAYFGEGAAKLHGDGSVLGNMTPGPIATIITPTVIDGTQYLPVTIGGTTYNLAIVIPGT